MTDYAKLASVASPAVQPPASSSSTGGDFSGSKSAQDAERAARYRLVIEEGPSGSFIYKTLDRMTGEVVRQLPREQVVDLMSTAEYSAGSVINTEA
jgi:flagellar protein FlaG